MHRVGRNDPCPCGSGRKYKRCCLGREEARTAFVRTVEDEALPLLRDLVRFSENHAGRPLEAVARAEFPFWDGPADGARGARAVEHVIFDYRPEGRGRRAIDEFAVARGPKLTPRQRETIERWSEAQRRLYRLNECRAGFLRCVDALSESAEPVDVMPLQVQGPIPEGVPLAFRALPAGGKCFCLGEPLRFEDRSLEEVAAAMRARHLEYVRRRRILSIGEFLRIEPKALDEEAARPNAWTAIIVPDRARPL